MLTIPEALQKKYKLLLLNSQIPQGEYRYFKKWLQFYLDFCSKYRHPYADAESLGFFLEKLRAKKQTPFQCSQAKEAVKLYFSGIKESKGLSKDKSSQYKAAEEIMEFDSGSRPGPWETAIDAIKKEIQVRHYSKKTLKAYSLWVEKFRYFTKDKIPESLTPEDVKDFLTFLAVKKKVSASSQNQAFHGLGLVTK